MGVGWVSTQAKRRRRISFKFPNFLLAILEVRNYSILLLFKLGFLVNRNLGVLSLREIDDRGILVVIIIDKWGCCVIPFGGVWLV